MGSFILKRPIFTSSIAFIGLFIIGTSLGILIQRKPSNNGNLNNIASSELVKPEKIKINAANGSTEISKKKERLDKNKLIPLITIDPSVQEIQFLIEAWLKGKSKVL